MAGDNLWIDGIISPFGSAPPDFLASAVNNEAGVQVVAGTLTCGNGNLTCTPASLEVIWANGTLKPFATLTPTSATVNLSNTALTSGIIRIGAESIELA